MCKQLRKSEEENFGLNQGYKSVRSDEIFHSSPYVAPEAEGEEGVD